MNLNLAKIYLDSSKIYLNLRKCVLNAEFDEFWNSDIDLFIFR